LKEERPLGELLRPERPFPEITARCVRRCGRQGLSRGFRVIRAIAVPRPRRNRRRCAPAAGIVIPRPFPFQRAPPNVPAGVFCVLLRRRAAPFCAFGVGCWNPRRCVPSVREVHSPQQVLETRLTAEWIEVMADLHPRQDDVPLLERLVHEIERGIDVA